MGDAAYWEREAEQSRAIFSSALARARETGRLEDARQAVYRRRWVRDVERLAALDRAFKGVPSFASNTLCRVATRRGIVDADADALASLALTLGEDGLLAQDGIGAKTAAIILTWARGREVAAHG